MSDDGGSFGLGCGLGARNERRVPGQAARCGIGRPVRARHPLRSAVGPFGSRWFSLGWALAVVAWGLHVGALALAPLSIVRAMLSGGLVFSRCSPSDTRLSTRTPAMGRRDHHRRRARGDRDHGWSHTSAPRPAGSSWVRAWPSSPSPQLPRISPRSRGGILVFRDPIGIGAPAIVGRVIAFGLVIAGAAFMPAPARAGRVVGVSQLATCPGPALSRGAAYSPNARARARTIPTDASPPRPLPDGVDRCPRRVEGSVQLRLAHLGFTGPSGRCGNVPMEYRRINEGAFHG